MSLFLFALIIIRSMN